VAVGLLENPVVEQSTAGFVVTEISEIDRLDWHEELVSYAGLDSVVHQLGE